MDDLKEIQGIFYSNNNKNVIKGVINGVIKNKFKNYDEIIDKIIDETIEYVFLKRNTYTIPKQTKKQCFQNHWANHKPRPAPKPTKHNAKF